ncbi:uncharacterized protein LOC108094770 [Drosophila ficusphila]|uniref:uncharacterized protein LOC108094770 n=1 Tax=Drosophila ficusphila TaxID=30025 RepID=UPI0007E82486|nr:uncharacterized protein LOC108094770 [Drosophila ficusphila]
MGLCTGTWISLVVAIATLTSAANIQRSDDSRIVHSNGNTFLSNGAGQIIRGPDGKVVLIGSDGRRIIANDDSSEEDPSQESGQNYNSNVIINGRTGSNIIQSNGHSFIYGPSSEGGVIVNSGYTVRIINGALELTENGKVYTFQPKPAGVNEQETVDINGQPAVVEYSNGNVIIELADKTVIAKVGDQTFLGDRYSFDNRDKLVAETNQYVQRVQQEVQDNLKKTMSDLNAQLQRTLGNIFV